MENIAQLIIKGQQEINRMQSELKMLTGIMMGMVSSEDFQGPRCVEFWNADKTIFWRITDKKDDLWVECFGDPVHQTGGPAPYVQNWRSDFAPSSPRTNGLHGVPLAHQSLDVFVNGMLIMYPYMRERIEPMIEAAREAA